MNEWTSLYSPLIGRILLGGFFLWSGIEKVLNFDSLVGYFGQLSLPQPLYLALAVITIEVLGGIAVIVDVQTRLTALLLALYLVCTSILFFRVTSVIETQVFLADMAIVGGLLVLGGLGSSKWSPTIRK